MNSNEDEKTNDGEDQIISILGEIGPWQWRNILITGVFCVPCCWHILIMTFMNASVDSWCARPPSLGQSISIQDWKNISGQDNGSCLVLDRDWSSWVSGQGNEDHRMVDCEQWEFDTSQFSSTITSEFGLVCGKEYLKSIAQTLYFVGMIFGVFTFGVLADIFGRKKVLIPLLMAISVSGILTSQMPTFETFIFGRLLNAFAVIGIFETYFTYMLEFVGGKWSTIIGGGVEYIWVTGWLSLGGLAYALRDWRDLMLYSSIPSTLSFVLFWLIPESPRWLLSTGRIEEAEDIVRSAAKFNKVTLPVDWKLKSVQKEKSRRTNLLDLFRYPNMRTKTLILYYNWFVNSFAYYGLAMNMGDLGGSDVYLNFTISGLLEIPAYTAAILFLLYFGRRVPYFSSMILCGASLLSIMLVPRGVYANDWPAMVVALFGKMCITFSWAVLFLYSAEIFPTEIRTSAIGSASFIGRFGGILAPWVELLGKNYHPYIPAVIFGGNALLAGLLAIWLPETQGTELAYTIEESEILGVDFFPESCNRKKKRTNNSINMDGNE
eukprot:GFUD01020396.1.p1 GENE.GFUD01020396.1~~GFUD01020396.1.p1  ORF type:complete len:549 (+),score=92.66 GFUD01020396.1:57-1703(+)